MERKISGRKLSTDMQRKLSAISNCSDVSNLSVILGMDPNDFKSTIQNILGKLNAKKLQKVEFTIQYCEQSVSECVSCEGLSRRRWGT